MKNKSICVIFLLFLAASLACRASSLGGKEQSYGPCDNVLYPFFVGAHWVYQVDNLDGSEVKKFGLTVVNVAESKATIDTLSFSTGITTQVTADCDNGAIRNFPFISQDMLIGKFLSSDFTMDYVSGVFAPDKSLFETNNWAAEWTTEFVINGIINVQDEGETVTITLKNTPLHMSWQTAGSGDAAFESITVPAGTFDRALKVNNEMTLDVTVDVAGWPANGTLTLRTSQWYEPFTGLIKSQIDSGEIRALGFSLPVTVKASLELVEYLTAH